MSIDNTTHVYALWCGADYICDGGDFCLGIYSDYVQAYQAKLQIQEKDSGDFHITKIELNRNPSIAGNYLGEQL